MNLRFLETFVLLAELRNFRMTAERLYTTQAAVSSRIATLEQEFGVRLFDRGVREVTLTADGAKALIHAERMLKLMREMREDMLDKQAYAGVIRIGAIESIVHSWFPEFLALLHQRYPRLRVEIASDTTIHMSEQLLKGQLDLSLQAKPVSSGVISHLPLGQFSMRWVASPSLGIGDEALGLAELAAFPIVSFARGTEPVTYIEQLFASEIGATVHLNCIASVATMIRVVCDGLGVATLPPAIIQRELADRSLRLLRVDRQFPSLPLVACYRNDLQNPLTEVAARVAEEAAIAFALRHGADTACPPGSDLAPESR
ncbi:HTH-type transcriptional regulator YofA [Delftia tsuruhatensis]|uniref:LysR family transcriptional regulator n=1 Tax=Delftia tsuruhatensis TaxID=180282 RepID=UPI001E73DCFB|nr:LysR family transcriptional regulator [Delftia tsuruhatensis]CAB5723318.1 HTH-type transcriptional regulator YofA [Delftia tsuruhatensis]CAC9691678.1 HTH-type transcriptional regulator YofA [Delftia tsuruhatensis]